MAEGCFSKDFPHFAQTTVCRFDRCLPRRMYEHRRLHVLFFPAISCRRVREYFIPHTGQLTLAASLFAFLLIVAGRK